MRGILFKMVILASLLIVLTGLLKAPVQTKGEGQWKTSNRLKFYFLSILKR